MLEKKVNSAWSGRILAIIGVSVLIISLIVAIGWFTQNEALIQIHSSFVPMQFNSALGFLLASTGLLAILYNQKALGILLGALAALLGLLTLIQYVFEINLGIDELFFKHYVQVKTSHPGRMAPNSAICFIIAGILISIIPTHFSSKKKLLVLNILGPSLMTLALLAFAGYLLHIESAYGWADLTRMAIHTSFCFILLASSFGIWAFTKFPSTTNEKTQWYSVNIFCIMVTLSFCFWQSARDYENRSINRLHEDTLNQFIQAFTQFLSHDLEVINGLAKQWSHFHPNPSPQWERDMISISNSHPEILSMGFYTFGKKLWSFGEVQGSFNKEILAHFPENSHFLAATNGHLNYLVPFGFSSKTPKFFISAIDIQKLIKRTASQLFLHMHQDGELIFGNTENSEAGIHYLTTTLELSNSHFEVQSWMPKSGYDYLQTILPNQIFLLGLALSLLTSISFFSICAYRSQLGSLNRAVKLINSTKNKVNIILNSTSDGICGLNPEGKITFVNIPLLKILDLSSDDVMGQYLCHLVGHRSQGKFNIEDAASPIDDVITRKNGSKVHVEYSISPIRENHRVKGSVAVIRDVTHRITTQKKLQASQNLIKSIINNAPSLITVKNLHGQYQIANHQFLIFNQLSEDSVLGHTSDELFPKNIAQKLQKTDSEVLEKKQTIRFEEQVEVGGEARHFLTTKFPLLNPENKACALCCISTDITEQKIIEERQAELVENLEETNRDLLKAQIGAELATVAKSSFLANISHEVRTPLNGVIATNSLLLETKLDPIQEKYANRIQVSAKILLDIISDILDLSKIEAGEMRIENIPCPLLKTVSEIEEVFTSKAREKGLKFTIECNEILPTHVLADPVRLKQILLNLSSNAFKFTKEGFIKIAIILQRLTKEEAKIRFEVIDSGEGIPKDKHKKIFSQFYQTDVSNTRKYGGTGLGLCISKQLVEMMGGQIGFHSKEGEGSTFWFEIPFPLIDSIKEKSCTLS